MFLHFRIFLFVLKDISFIPRLYILINDIGILIFLFSFGQTSNFLEQKTKERILNMENGMKKKLTPEEELEIDLEILNNSMIKSEMKFIICMLIILLCGVFPWLVGMGVIVRFLGKTIIF